MTIDSPIPTHEGSSAIIAMLASRGVSDLNRPLQSLEQIQESGITDDLLVQLWRRLVEVLPKLENPERVLDDLQRFIAAARSPQVLASLFERDPASLASLLWLFAASPRLAEWLIGDPEAFDLLRLTEGQPVSREILIDEIVAECATASTTSQAQEILRRYRQRETLRIAYGDLVERHPVERVSEQLAFLADAILQAAIDVVERLLAQKRGGPPRGQSGPVRLAVVATGRLGGNEMDYGDQLDLLLITSGTLGGVAERPDPAAEYADQVAEGVVQMLAPADGSRPIYTVSQPLQPGAEPQPPEPQKPGVPRISTGAQRTPSGGSTARATDITAALREFNVSGRTWHRQEFIKARAVAGDVELGAEFLDQLAPWIYTRYLRAVDQEGIRAMTRKLGRRGPDATAAEPRVWDLYDSTQEIERVVQFLQLLNAADLPTLRVGNTWRAIAALEQTGCLTMQERSLLSEHYGFLRRLEHRLQLALPVPSRSAETLRRASTKPVPNSAPAKEPPPAKQVQPAKEAAHAAEGLWRIAAASLGFQDADHTPDVASLRTDCRQRRQVCRRIIDHLMHEGGLGDAGEFPFETEMVLDPQPDPLQVSAALRGYGFARPQAAYAQLVSLAREPIRFLSDRRSRHFLASIAPKLLAEIAATPSPDATLANLAAVSDSLGGKAALWELFQTTPPTMRLCVRLCASSPYLTGILIGNPGMIDELIDSLILDRLPQTEELDRHSIELCRFAEDIDPILHSFKNSAHLRIGVRDVLGRDDIRATHRALADTAESCLRRLVEDELDQLADRYGQPLDADGRRCGVTVVALGRLGGREPNYHSQLDVLFLYDGDGQTRPRGGGRREGTTNNHFFNELAQRIGQRVNRYGPSGRMYELETPIRLSGGGDALAVTLSQFQQYCESQACTLTQRLALLSGRIIYGAPASAAAAEQAMRHALLHPGWDSRMAAAIREHRLALQHAAAPQNLKRGVGGTLDVETAVQMLLLRHAAELDQRPPQGTFDGIETLRQHGWISGEHAQQLAIGYRYLRSVESNLRLMNTSARHDMPESGEPLRLLAFLLREAHPGAVVEKCAAYRATNRQLFDAIFAEASGGATKIAV